jgi:hypothetical protein
MLLHKDYDYGGRTIEERSMMWEKINNDELGEIHAGD